MKKIVKLYIVLFVVVMLFGLLNGQVNIEKQRKAKNEKLFETILGFSMTLYKGNTDMFIFNTDVRFDLNRGRNSGFVIGKLSYGEKNDESYLNKGFIHIRYIRNISRKFMLESFAQMEFNDFILLNRRSLAGFGIRLHLLEKKIKSGDINLYLGSGLMFENEIFNTSSEDILKEETSLYKSTNYISVSYSSDKFSISDVTYLQTNIGDEVSTRIYSDLIFAVRLSKKLSFTTSFTYRYDNNPAPTVKNYDIQLKNGLKLIL